VSGVLIGAVCRSLAEVVKGAERRSGPLTTGGGGRDCADGDGAEVTRPPNLRRGGLRAWHDRCCWIRWATPADNIKLNEHQLLRPFLGAPALYAEHR
jgi:hypothetical protein